eukprot:4772341-Alexandrium_andersonii.AAC.1
MKVDPAAGLPCRSAAFQEATWEPVCAKVQTRVNTVTATTSSAGRRADQWNVFIVSCLPYHAQIASPTAAHQATLRAAF